MNDVLKTILETQAVHTEDGEMLPLHSHLPEFEARVLQFWAKQCAPHSVLEIGLGYGISSLYISDVLAVLEHDVAYHILDPFQESGFKNIGLLNLDRAGYAGTYTFQSLESELALPQFLAQGKRFDFIFIDGNHEFEHVFVDYFYSHRLLNPKGIIVFDDIHMEDILRVTQHLSQSGQYQKLILPSQFDNRQTRLRRLAGYAEMRIGAFIRTG